MLYAYFKYEVNGETQTRNDGFRLVYDETKKSWFIDSISVHEGDSKEIQRLSSPNSND
jgi:hypothetical protein